MSTPLIMLWCHPRCLSTAFERAIFCGKVAICKHEPFSKYYTPGGHIHSLTAAEEDTLLENLFAKHKRPVFVKDMAYHLLSQGEEATQRMMTSFEHRANTVHSFLIRDPCKSVASLDRMVHEEEYADLPFIEEEVGVKELYGVFKHVTETLKHTPVVVDADDLIRDPERVLRAYCRLTDLPYSPAMLEWRAGQYPESWNESRFEGWHDDVKSSTGFKVVEHLETLKEKFFIGDHPRRSKDIDKAIRTAIPLFNEMRSHRL